MTRSCLSLLFVVLAAAPVSVRQADVPPATPMSQAEMEARVRLDAARWLRVMPDSLKIVQTEERTWPDRGLGCHARRGVLAPAPTPGFRVVVQAGARRLTYHTDRFGRALRCAAPIKPLDPIR